MDGNSSLCILSFSALILSATGLTIVPLAFAALSLSATNFRYTIAALFFAVLSAVSALSVFSSSSMFWPRYFLALV